MINVAHTKAALAALEGDTIALPKAQVAQLLDEVESGQRARRALINIKTIIAIGANAASVPA
ncbi:hypothetical protein [Sphingomonas sp. TREG-RG-20F-R18-01]|uniref:hypothetical protein n=1 Tax=Sphingomonas sp. TREG-RG-20F-R18-01 TaxID=2914982 RepID=UPI001F5994A4|nr:hypothetical protein [Sphingomonas sp. TREG-RG-20F-R18-01]